MTTAPGAAHHAQPLAPPADASPAAPPNTLALHCPLCAYNLTGLTTPQCPECGHEFEWAELTDPARQRLPGLFEHGRTRLVRDYFLTQVRSLRPYRFWRTLRPSHKLVPRRLAVYFLISQLLLILLLVIPLVAIVAWRVESKSLSNRRLAYSGTFVVYRNDYSSILDHMKRNRVSANQVLEEVYPDPSQFKFWRQVWDVFASPRGQLIRWGLPKRVFLPAMPFYVGPGLAASMPAATLVALASLRWTFARARVKRVHAFRVGIYSTDLLPYALIAAVCVAYFVITWFLSRPGSTYFDNAFTALDVILFNLALVMSLLSLLRLHAALRLYLGFPHAAGVTLATAVIAILLTLLLWL